MEKRNMKVYKVELQIIDFDRLGEEDIKSVIESTKYPNYCINPKVRSIESVDIEWTDTHPLNMGDTAKAEYERLFPKK